MWKRNILTTISKAFLPRSRFFAVVDPIPESQFSTAFHCLPSVAREEDIRVLPNRLHQFIGNFSFSAKNCSSKYSNEVLARCWNCDAIAGTTTPFLVCDSCRSIQPVDHSVNYFQIFGLEKKYEIEDQNLEGKYKGWQKKLHPDLVHSKSKKEREYAAEQSTRVIDAYRTLTDPLSRAMYILNLEDVHVDEEKTVSEPELLVEILDIREAVEEAADSQTLNQIQAQIQEKFKHWSKSFENAFQRQNYEAALTCIQRMTYYKRVKEEIVKKL